MARNRVAALIFGSIGILVLLVAGAILLLYTIDMKPLVERYATEALDRRLAIGALQITGADPLSLELRDLRLANAPWGREPDMVRIDRLSAELAIWPLLHGRLEYRKLSIDGASINLERDAQGKGNWRFGGSQQKSGSGFALIPKNRAQFPTLIDGSLRNGKLTLRNARGAELRLDLRDAKIRTAGDDQDITLTADGAYNDIPARLEAKTQSFAVLRNPAVPFGAAFSIATTAGTVDFKGTMMEPLDFEGVRGPMAIKTERVGEFLRIVGAGIAANFPFELVGNLEKAADDWQLHDVKGKLAGESFDGTVALREGRRGNPDHANLAVNLSKLDLRRFLAEVGANNGKGTRADGDVSLHLAEDMGLDIDGRLHIDQVDYGKMRIADLGLDGAIASGNVDVRELAFPFAAGRVKISGIARAVPGGTRVAAQGDLSAVDADQAARFAGAPPGQIAGRFDAGLVFEMTGATFNRAMRTSRGYTVMTMTNGRIARELVEMASTDLRALFRKSEGWTRITCLAGLVEIRNGIGTISPLILQTPEGTLTGRGQVDLLRRHLELLIKSRARSIFALEVPIRISGDFRRLSVEPAFGAGPEPTSLDDPMRRLPAPLRPLVAHTPCLG
ncbi:MAG: AsmA family protein [Rhodospirillaceae bacterium]|nr:AsmA family protein [Rhodospirillaceae bacterium]